MLASPTYNAQVPEWQRLGFVPGLTLRAFGMRRSGNHAIIGWLQRNAPQGRALFLNDCRRRQHPMEAFASVQANGQKVSRRRARGNLPKIGRELGDGALLLISYEDVSPLHNLPGKPISGDFNQSLISRNILIYRSFLNWAASMTKKLETNKTFSIVRRMSVLLRSVDLYGDLLSCVRKDQDTQPICYDDWAANPDYRADTLQKLGLEQRDNSLGDIPSFGGGSSFQKDTDDSAQLTTDQRWRQMLGDPLYQHILQISARDPKLLARIESLFPEDAAILQKIAGGSPMTPEALQ